MKKLVITTAAITLAAIIALISLVYTCLALFSPKTVAGLWSSLGNYGLSVKYYGKQYSKTGDVADLAYLCLKLDERADNARAAKYLESLTDDEGFSDYCARADEIGESEMTAYEYYYGKYAVAVYYGTGIGDAVVVAEKAVSTGYTEYNAFYVLLIDVETLTASDRQAIAAAITEIKAHLTGEEEQIAARDLEIVGVS